MSVFFTRNFYSLLHIYEEEKRKREEEEEDVLTARYHHLHHHEYEYQYRASFRVIKICPCDENDDENDDAQKCRSIDDCDEVVRTTWTTTRRTSSRGRRKNEGDERE